MVEHLLPLETTETPDGAAVVTLTLEQGGRPVVVIDADLLARLDATLDTLPETMDGFVLASSAPRAFVAGADLKAITAMDDAALHEYLKNGARVFQRIADLPCPTAAAVHSVALGGGLELAMHCDALIGLVDPDAKPYPIGLPEAGLKICPGWGGTNLLPARIDPERAIAATATGAAFKSDQADDLGLFDATATTPEGVIDAARAWVTTNTAPARNGTPARCIGPGRADEIEQALNKVESDIDHADQTDAVLDCVRVGIGSGWAAAIEREREHLVRLRHTEPAREAIRAFFDKGK